MKYKKITLPYLRELEKQLNEETRRFSAAWGNGVITDLEYTQAAIERTGKRRALRWLANRVKMTQCSGL